VILLRASSFVWNGSIVREKAKRTWNIDRKEEWQNAGRSSSMLSGLFLIIPSPHYLMMPCKLNQGKGKVKEIVINSLSFDSRVCKEVTLRCHLLIKYAQFGAIPRSFLVSTRVLKINSRE
jgi:hypothetical protein